MASLLPSVAFCASLLHSIISNLQISYLPGSSSKHHFGPFYAYNSHPVTESFTMLWLTRVEQGVVLKAFIDYHHFTCPSSSVWDTFRHSTVDIRQSAYVRSNTRTIIAVHHLKIRWPSVVVPMKKFGEKAMPYKKDGNGTVYRKEVRAVSHHIIMAREKWNFNQLSLRKSFSIW